MWNKEIAMVEKYNLEHIGEEVQIVIDNFKNTFWLEDKYNNRLTVLEEKKVWEYYGD